MSHLEGVREHYEQALRSTGDSGRRVGWRDTAAQTTRFGSFLRLMTGYSLGSVADIGCGTADFLSFLRSEGWAENYVGVDISPRMIEEATERFKLDNCSRFLVTESLPRADFLIASGIFNVSLKTEPSVWKAYCEETIIKMWQSAQQGIMFNMLSIDSEPERRQRHLTYFDPSDWLRFVREHLSAHVRLDQSYGQFDFSIAVFRSASSTSQRNIEV